ncbi:MAG: hypothetical protein IJE29_06780 [Firmicutes bacterium]|nr:hypothetical protein [Bacillota bacterium]
MMVSPEAYYEYHLKGKTAAEILSVIRGLKREIGHLKKMMEDTDYGPVIVPSTMDHLDSGVPSRLQHARAYLAKAQAALAEAGGIYNPSQAELRAITFNANIPAISQIVLSTGKVNKTPEVRTIIPSNDHLTITLQQPYRVLVNETVPMTRDDFLAAVRSIHIGEWRKNYSPHKTRYDVSKDIRWELQVYYANGSKPFTASGRSCYPYNFFLLRQLFQLQD